MSVRLLFVLLLTLGYGFSSAQTFSVSGTVQKADGTPLQGATVALLGYNTSIRTDANGFFEFPVKSEGNYTLIITAQGYLLQQQSVEVDSTSRKGSLAVIMQPGEDAGKLSEEDIIPVISVDETSDQSQGSDFISGVLSASRDVFISTSAFTLGPLRFRIRGLDGEYSTLHLNGIPINDIENGRVAWNTWGGLNDVLRERDIKVGLTPADYGFGGPGGVSNINLRAGTQWKQTRFSTAISNRNYRQRIMFTHSGSTLNNRLAFSVSVSRRFANEGYIAGTFYDAWSYFTSLEYKVNDRHRISASLIGSSIKSGLPGSSVQEMNDLAGTNFYNSSWGYQNGEKRNARVRHTHQPLLLLNHDWEINKKTKLFSGIAGQTGRTGTTALDWYNAPDPRPDYYRRLPSFAQDEFQKEKLQDLFENDESIRQINWENIYNINRNSIETISNANGIAGNNVTGKRAKYILEERRADVQRYIVNSYLQHNLSDRIKLFFGITFQQQRVHYFKTVNDLLGADFYVNLNQFAERESPQDPTIGQNDMETPNRILREGDAFGYDYLSVSSVRESWAQVKYSLKKWDLFASANYGATSFHREGKNQNGLFPDNSFGKSKVHTFITFGIKGGATFKVNGRNYLFANASYAHLAPQFRNVFVSPRTRDQAASNLTTEKVASAEGGFIHSSPKLRMRAVAYLTEIKDAIRTRSFYHDEKRTFVNQTLSGLNSLHTGFELGAEVKLSSTLSLTGVAALGNYIYTSRPTAELTEDNRPELISETKTIYMENFRVAGTPQTALSGGLGYRSPKYWFVNLNVNYIDRLYLDINPERRTLSAVEGIEPGSETWRGVIDQTKAPASFSVDFFGGYSVKLNQWVKAASNNTFLYLNVGVSNLLNNTKMVTGGFEQLRFDFADKNPDKFPPRHFYNYGRTYFINLSIKF